MASFEVEQNTDKSFVEEILVESPRVITIENFVTDIECEHMIRVAKPFLTKSVVSDDRGGHISAGRTSSTAWIDHDHDEITLNVGKRIAAQVGIPLENAEKFQVVYYDKNQRYNQHYDSWDHDASEKTLRCIKTGGCRLVTALVYLNDVKKGGATRFTRLENGKHLDVQPNKRKLLTFENVTRDEDGKLTIFKHPHSEHAGMPVIEGEKYMFNLWFRECERNRLYSDYNPEYYKKYVDNVVNKKLTVIKPSFDEKNKLIPIGNSYAREINKYESFIGENECNMIIESCLFDDLKKGVPTFWIKNETQPDIIKSLEKITKINSKYYENISVVRYSSKHVHGPFYDAYDITNERNKVYMKTVGNRLKTIVIPLTNNIVYKFDKLDLSIELNSGDAIIYKNLNENTSQRCSVMSHIVTNNNEEYAYLINIYIRENDKVGKDTINKTSINKSSNTTQVEKGNEDHHHSYKMALQLLGQGKCGRIWKGFNSFKYIWKGDEKYFSSVGKEWVELVRNGKGINLENLKHNYEFSEYKGIVVNNTIHHSLLDLFKKYIKRNIIANAYEFKDRQSDRWKSNDEPLTRFLHYELLALIEKITGKRLKPSYTYLCGYVNGADLPSHTDRPECEYTVSFLIEKDANWPIYLHKKKQEVANKGRTGERYLDHSECVELDCEEGGIIMFQGCDHLHFRHKYEGKNYNVVLLHYMSA
tara:strand:- start:421 stop:2526 length:2106 start_codon:yes stop_codon:yes gene_type:complete